MRTFTIFSQRLAGFLMQNGFILEGLGINNSNTEKRVFFFKDSEELQKAIIKYKREVLTNECNKTKNDCIR